MLALSFIFLSFIASFASGWPRTGERPRQWQLDTAMVHNNCCTGHQHDLYPHPEPYVKWSEGFTMDFTYFIVPRCDSKDPKLPPYYPAPQDPYYSIHGKTYSDATYRGGSQKEEYHEKCLPIFYKRSLDWSCEFINVSEEGQSYLVSHGNHDADFGDCCIMAKPFTAPGLDFTEKLSYGGEKDALNGRKYHSFSVNVEMVGGPFEYSFWNEKKELGEDYYYEPAFFYFLGQDDKCQDYIMSQQFHDFNPVAPDHSVFDIPVACKADSVTYCPGFAPSVVDSE